MSVEISTDILQLLPFEEWPRLQSKLKYNWPNFAYYYYWIENAIRWKKRKPDIAIQLYCPKGDNEYSTFIGISRFSIYILIAFSLEETGETLRNVLIETKLIPWNQGIYIAAVHCFILPTILSVTDHLKDTQNVERTPLSVANYFFKSAEECAQVEICVPEECYLKVLDKSDIPTIHMVWPHKDPNRPDLSMKYLITMVEMNGGMGLYLKKSDHLVSWAIHTDWYGMGMVQTLEEHTRKGYAKVVINALAKNLAKEGVSTTLYIVQGNSISQKMFRSLGWRSISPVAWVILKRKQST